jgi:hypothetical protein
MTKHLATCPRRLPHLNDLAGPDGREGPLLHLVVAGRYDSTYWLQLEVPAMAKLTRLDSFLRRTWLECCGHLSAFEIGTEGYFSSGARELEGRSMDFPLRRLLTQGAEFYHQYDFGSTTHLVLRVAGERWGLTDGKTIVVMARNDPPALSCVSCGKAATRVCTQCSWETEGWLCDECALEHECGEELQLPIVNSPRVGVCAYSG